MKLLFSFIFCCLFLACAQSPNKGIGYKGHGGDSVAPKLLKKFAPKALPSQKLKRIEALLDVRSPGMGILSPSGNELFFSWGVTGTRQIWKIKKNSRFPVQMTGGQDGASLRAVSPNGKFIVLSRDEKGNEYPYIYIQNSQGGALQFIAGGKKIKTSFQFLSKDSRYLYYFMNDKGPTTHTLYKHDLKNNTKKELYSGLKGYLYVADYKDNGEILIGNATGNIAREYYIFNEGSKKIKALLGQGESEQYDMAFSRRAGEYLVLTNKFGEYHRLYSYKAGKFKSITPEIKHNVSGFSIDRKRTRILYSVNRDGYSEARAMSARSYRKIKLPFPKGKGVLHTYAGRTTPNSNYTIFGVIKAQDPFSSYIVNWKTGRYSQWVFPSSPEVNTRVFVEPKLEYYTARDGVKIPMFVRRPSQCKNKLCPVIVKFHGGPEGQSRPNFSTTAQLYMEEGFILVEPNVRGSSGYSKAWLNSDNGSKRLNVITDIEDASIYIKKHWAKNAKTPKIGVMGGSYGGYSTNIAMTMFAGAYDAGVSIVGMSSLVTFLENTGPFRRHLRTSEYGDPEKDLEALKKLSPVTYLDRIKDPLLIIHGATDPRVPAGEAIQIYNVMEDKKLEGDLILFADEGHGIRKRKNQALYLGHTIEFFKKHLK